MRRGGEAAAVIAIVAFFAGPLLALLVQSFRHGPTAEVLSFFAAPRTTAMLWNTAVMVAGGAAIALAAGAALGLVVSFADLPGRSLLSALVWLPLILPSYVVALSWAALFEKNGLLDRAFGALGVPWPDGSVYGLSGMTVVMGLTHYPLVYLFVIRAARRVPEALYAAARASGARPLRAFLLVVLPLLRPALAAGGALAFLAALDNFGIPAFLGIPANVPVLSTSIYEQIAGFGPSAFARAAALSLLLMAIALMGLYGFWLWARRDVSEAFGDGGWEGRVDLGPLRWPLFMLILVFLLLTSILPLVGLGLGAIVRAYGLPPTPENWTLKHFAAVLADGRTARAAFNSGLIAIGAAVVTVAIGTGVALRRRRRPGLPWRVVGGLMTLPFALPGIVVALGLIVFWASPVGRLAGGVYGTLAMLWIAYTVRFGAIGVRSAEAALARLDRRLEQAAQMSGARLWARLGRIVFPLIAGELLGGMVLVVLLAGTELTLSVLLASSGQETVGMRIFQLEQGGALTEARALAFLIAVFVFLLFVLAEALRRGGFKGETER
ncbi:ABC transporter permease [Hydrogenibacillus schlegelii]|uniref:ABC transporter permease n=1 Tax=Hydrogenibacillus schlegelii TaxID=1484 RepID=UPI0008366135|nr:iron ABC transporter permease [Hydrogenibacillus schlegelii]